MATIAIGDIHGHLEPLRDLLAAIAPEVGRDDDVVFLGDYIDRGLDSRGCVDALLDFRARVPARVTFLLGNHEEWLRKTRADHTDHAWLRAMDAMVTVRSYSPAALAALQRAIGRTTRRMYEPDFALPYEAFFEAMPEAHHAFFDGLQRVHVTPDAVCTHGGLDPRFPFEAQPPRAMVWGALGFPEDYAGPPLALYGHHNDAEVDADGWPRPRVSAWAIGLDTIASGVLTAVRLPDRAVWQSRRHATRDELEEVEQSLWEACRG